ncbi:hypothetical protein FOZ63_021450, partial [Perkinsus olseni]
GCNGGTIVDSIKYADVEGIVKASSYPYKAKLGACKTSVTSDPRKQCVRPNELTPIYIPPKDEAAMISEVAMGPVAVGLYASAPAFEFYKSGIITGKTELALQLSDDFSLCAFVAKTCGVSTTNHYVTIVGYNTSSAGIRYWKVMNSWGKSWGMKGFGYIERTGNQPGPCNILSDFTEVVTYVPSIRTSVCATGR